MYDFLKRIHNKRPLLWSVVAFIIVIGLATTMSVWWNVLLVQNHRVVKQMAAAAQSSTASFPLALLMVFGILSSTLIVSGLLYFFLRLLRSLQMNLAQSNFISSVTHELRSPVTSLGLLLETLADPGLSDAQRKEFQTLMKIELDRLSNTVDQVLDAARLENFLTDVSKEEVNIRALLANCLESLTPRLKISASEINVSDVDPELSVMINRRLLTQSILNIIDNALKYSNGPAKISIMAVATPKGVDLVIADNGIGLAKKEQKKIFRRFYRSGNALTQSRAGTGLGLYFSKLALKAQGAEISAKSEGPGRGTSFYISLPNSPRTDVHT